MQVARSCVLLSGILFYYFPAIVYKANADFFESSFAYITLLMLPAFIIAAALFWFPALLIREKWKAKYAILLASLAFVGWFIGNFLVTSGLLDGQQALNVGSLLYQRVEFGCAIAAFALLTAAGLRWPKVYGTLRYS